MADMARWPWVSRARYEVEVRRLTDALTFCRTITDRERALHDAARAEVVRLTTTLADIAKPQLRSLPMPIPTMPGKIVAGIQEIAKGDKALERLLLDRARMCVRTKPNADPSAVVEALRFGPDAIAAFLLPTEQVA